MTGETHVAAGMLAGAAVGAAAGAEYSLFVGALAGAMCGKLPDILEGNVLQHRKLTHSVWAVTFLYLAVTAIRIENVPQYILLAAWSSYVSHIILDATTISGVYWLHPVSRHKLHLMPRPLRPRTGGRIDQLVAAVAAGIVMLMIWQALDVDLMQAWHGISEHWGIPQWDCTP